MKSLPKDLEKTVAFHGHLCPGLLIGYRATKAALSRLGASRAEDEELIATVENNSCAVDAVQVLAGATFGKGNLFFKDYGKQVFTFARRPAEEKMPGKKKRVSVKAVRVALRPQAFGSAPPSREERMGRLLSAAEEELFKIEETTIALPPEAEIRKSVICDQCGEPVMETRTKKRGNKILCLPCAQSKKR